MKKKQFKTESEKLLNMMINSIYTHKEIFLRELISNASDALDKLYFRSLTDSSVKLSREDLLIFIKADKDARTLTISDNGCGMSALELENNLGTIAKSGSFEFKRDNEQGDDVDVIGQFGVGFYSAFMVAEKITVKSREYGSEKASVWESSGVDGYKIGECEKTGFGTEITLQLKPDDENEKYSEYLEEYRIRELIRKYSDYIRYPIKMDVTRSEKKEGTESEYESVTKTETLNTRTPIWKREDAVTNEEYAAFYSDKFYDFEPPLKVVRQKSEGTATYTALLFIPSRAPYNYYSKDYEKGLELYSSGVMIMERCADLIPDHFAFVRGLVDSADLSLNISREMLQHDRQLKVIAKAIEKKIKSELEKMLKSERDSYEKMFDAFGLQLKFGLYADYGMHKDTLKDLVMFKSSREKKYVTLKEYVEAMPDGQADIYYAAGESIERIEILPQLDAARKRGYEVLYLTDDVDEFSLKMLSEYDGHSFKNITGESFETLSDVDKEKIEKENEANRQMLDFIKAEIPEISAVRLTSALSESAVCLTSEGELSLEMQKVLSKMPGGENVPKANVTMEINSEHPITAKLKLLYETDKQALKQYARVLYSIASIISGLTLSDPKSFSTTLSDLLSK